MGATLKNTTFMWCSSGSQLDMAAYDWVNSQPNYGVNQSCLVHTTGVSTAMFGTFSKPADNGLNDWECFDSMEYLCEEP